MKRIFLYLNFLIILFISFICNVMADDIDLNIKGELNVILLPENIGNQTNVGVKLYQISTLEKADLSLYTYNEEFDSKIDNNSDISSVLDYIDNNDVSFLEVNTNSEGIAQFNNLVLGKYIVIVDDVKVGDYTYKVDSFFVNIPYDDNGWSYVLTAQPKVRESAIEGSSSSVDEILPLTGTLLYLVPILLICGIVCIVLGSLIYNEKMHR